MVFEINSHARLPDDYKSEQIDQLLAGKAIAAAAAASLPPGDIAAAQQRGRNLDLWQTAGELLEELG